MTSRVGGIFAGILLLLASTCYCDNAVVNGNWSEWGAWPNCSASCGTGNITRYRTCTNPSPEIGGSQCNGTVQESKLCDTNVTCPSVNGNWSEWGAWPNCSASCATGNITRYRTCTNPSPENGGSQCNGTSQESNLCENVTCPVVDGNWSEWGAWHNCSASCGTGNITRYRTCTNPSPENGGSQCNGTAQESKPCDTNVTCPVNGGWSDWDNWSPCTVSCGAGGEQVRSRACNNPPPSNGGLPCWGDSSETSDCDQATQAPCCPWGEWSACSGGFRLRIRDRAGDCASVQGNPLESEICSRR
ncbi:coadhesin-like isoform X1 [Asterias rubens]|uniref:coadhesin-like isoform X1 n=1 Tax=Asterias rubens TaxID=7604 RepID=UPI001455C1B4|nr:coadhesin-like isoform X1 [Asterias rubens]